MTDFNIDTLEPHPREAIVIEFDATKTSLDEINRIFNDVVDKFPNNTVIALPNYMSLQSLGKDVLENYISMLAEVIEEL